jgi:hypothetical protein
VGRSGADGVEAGVAEHVGDDEVGAAADEGCREGVPCDFQSLIALKIPRYQALKVTAIGGPGKWFDGFVES